jgi:dihydrofolate reductase
VISRAAGFRPEGAHVVHDFDAALSLGQQLGRAMNAASVIVAGGGEIYAGLIGRADRIELTEVDVEFAGRTRFPLINPDEWQETAREEGVRGPKDEAAFRFVTYERRARSAPPVEKRGDGT